MSPYIHIYIFLSKNGLNNNNNDDDCWFIELPADTILELFGKCFFEFCQDSGYDKILQVLGATPRDFLQVKINSIRHFF